MNQLASKLPLAPVILPALLALLACAAPRLGNGFFAWIETSGAGFAKRKRAVIFSVGAAAILLRVSLLPWMPIAPPEIHDEFSYLLEADTFSHGRLTNPPHPMSLYLETFHVNQHPTYQSKYPPAQGVALAIGQLLGNPWIGVLLSVGVMCGAIVWALQGWMPPGWALLGGILALLRLAVSGYWINSYWGGAVAAIGGALVIGSLPRVVHSCRARDGFALGVGVSILASSRPFEGLLFCLPVGLALLTWLLGPRGPRWQERVRGVVIPALSIMVLCGLFTAAYNRAGTGHALLFPYTVNDRTYMSTPSLVWEKIQPLRHYSNPQFDGFYNGWSRSSWQAGRADSIRRTAWLLVHNAGRVLLFFVWPELCLPLLAIPWLLMDRRMRFPVLQAAVCFLGFLLVVWWPQPHYMAPLTTTLFILITQGMRHLRRWRIEGRWVGIGLSRAVFVSALLLAPFHHYYERLQPTVDDRARIAKELEKIPGNQLVIVQYAPDHNVLAEWVYNRADIDHSKIVWAREIPGVDMQPLLDYFHGRQAWVVAPDQPRPKLLPYELNPTR